MSDTYSNEEYVKATRDRLMASKLQVSMSGTVVFRGAINVPLQFEDSIEAETEKIPGWRFKFVPEEGVHAGQEIERTFICKEGFSYECMALLFRRYGMSSQVIAGMSLWENKSWGDWNGR